MNKFIDLILLLVSIVGIGLFAKYFYFNKPKDD